MKYPPVPLVTELTLPIFFCLSLPYVLTLIIIVIWLRLLPNGGKQQWSRRYSPQLRLIFQSPFLFCHRVLMHFFDSQLLFFSFNV
uniref:Uncharacterized protein n=1 Tax=Pavo cristatus TaxID=9049 RepID=A0A8C9FBC8_PAVCR